MNGFYRSQFFGLFLFVFASTSICAEYHHATFKMNFTQSNDRAVKEAYRPNHDFSHSREYDAYDTFSNNKLHFNNYTVHDFKDHFIARGYTESEILNQRCLYMLDEFVKYAQTYSGYEDTIRSLYAELKNLSLVQKVCYMATGRYCRKLQNRITHLHSGLDKIKAVSQHNNIYKSSSFIEKSSCPSSVVPDRDVFSEQFREYKTLEHVYNSYAPCLAKAINERSVVYNNLSFGDFTLLCVNKSYNLNNNVKQILSQYGHETKCFTQCFGNQLQQIIHQESLDLLGHIESLSHGSVLYDHQEALVDLTISMFDYNHAGLTDKAMSIGDLCWTLLDYGQAIAEGAALGIYSAAHDILTNPIEATVSIVAGKQVLAFQLCKVLYNVAEIGATAITNFDEAQEKWNKYTEPLNNIIDAINKKEITVRDAIKGGAAFVVGYKAQGKLLGGLGKLCNTIKHKSINFVKNNSLLNSQEYLTTPEGLLFKATGQTGRLGQTTPSKLKNGVDDKVFRHQSIKGLLKKEGLPTKGKLRYVPPKKLHVAGKLPEVVWHDRRKGFVDRFGNVWLKGKSRTKGHDFEWDVQLSKQGIQQVGWMTRDNSHLNVSLDGRVTHK